MVFSTQEFLLFTQELIHFTQEILPLLPKKLQTPYSRNLRIPSNTAPLCTSNADGKRFLLLHVPATPPSFSAQEKTTTLGGTEPHHSS